MFLFQGECKTVNDTSKNLKQLRDTVVPLRLVNEPVKYVVDGLPDEGSMCHEFSIDPVQDRLEVIALARVLCVKELEELENEGIVDVLLPDLSVHLVGDYVSQQEFVNDLQVRPRWLKSGLFLFRVKVVACRVPSDLMVGWWQSPEEVLREHVRNILENSLREFPLTLVDVVHQLQKRLALDLFLPHVCCGVREVERVRAQLQFLDEQVLPLRSHDIAEEEKRLVLVIQRVHRGDRSPDRAA